MYRLVPVIRIFEHQHSSIYLVQWKATQNIHHSSRRQSLHIVCVCVCVRTHMVICYCMYSRSACRTLWDYTFSPLDMSAGCKTRVMPVSMKDCFRAGLCLTIQRQQLLSSPLFVAPNACLPTCALLRRVFLFKDIGRIQRGWLVHQAHLAEIHGNSTCITHTKASIFVIRCAPWLQLLLLGKVLDYSGHGCPCHLKVT